MTFPMTDNSNMETNYQNCSNNQENFNIKVKKKRIKQKAVNLKSEEKTENKRPCKQLRNETLEQRELRLKRQREYRESRTPEQREASRLKNALYTRRYRQEQLDSAQTPEEKEALLQKRKEYSKNYREKLKSLAKTPEEKEALRLKLVIEKRRSIEKLKKLPDRDCKGRLCIPEEIEARRVKRINEDEDKSLLCLKKRWEATQKMREYRHRKGMQKQIGLNLPIAVEEIKIEKEILQETTIKAIPSLQNADLFPSMLKQGTSWSWYEPSSESVMTFGTSKSYLDHSRSFIDQDNFQSNKSHSTKIERRKTRIEKSLNYMRELVDVKAKVDSFAVFGEYIAQRLRTPTTNEAEVNTAKLLINNVLQNLTIGFYSSESHCEN